jgi:two-component system, LytTR family, sensor kinase
MTDKESSINNFFVSLFGFQKTKNAKHFIFIIFVHLAAWCLFLLLPLIFYPIRFSRDAVLYGELASKLLPIGFFYLNYYYLLPRFFEKRKFLNYFIAVLSVILLIAAQELLIRTRIPGRGVRVFSMPIGRPPSQNADTTRDFIFFRGNAAEARNAKFPFPAPPFEQTIFGIPRGIVFMSVNRSISLCVVLLLIGGLIRLGYSFLRNQNEKKALENAHLNAEVNFLKSQINPHFLFNTLNGIYAQAHQKSEHTEFSILKLSELLRYVLYDSGGAKVDLAKDIQYLTNYIDLQKLRISQKVSIEYKVTGKTGGKQIAPLLLITFVENAFKHGISYTRPSSIKIHVGIFEKTLTLLVSNPVVETNSFAAGGLGLKNVTRRLDLLYPGNYLLDILHNEHLHIVNLKINLDCD